MTAVVDHTQNRVVRPVHEQDMVIGTFDTQDQAERAVRRLLDAGTPAAQLSIVTQGLEARKEVQGYVTAGDGARTGVLPGAWVGGLVGLFTGAAFVWVPVIGPLVVLGALASTVAGALEGGAAGGLLGALWGRHMQQDHVLKYQEALQGGKLVVTIHGTPQELEAARRVLGETSGRDVRTYTYSPS
jgi:hypothetical protein